MTRADEADEARLQEFASDLATAIESALPGWVLRCVTSRCAEAGVLVDDNVVGAAAVAGTACVRDVGPRVRHLLAQDLDEQVGTPLALLRTAVRYPNRVLDSLGVPPADRDEFSRRSFPGDNHDLSPATFGDVADSLHEPGLMWGAAKAHVHLARRKAEGFR